MRHLLLAGPMIALLIASAPAWSAKSRQTAAEAAHAFLQAFIAMDTPRFESFFADDATMFFPAGPFPQQRVEGKKAITAAFRNFFEIGKKRGVTRLGINPLDLKVQDHGSFAIVSFHLHGNDNVGRRSLILRRERDGWRIVHFHASSL